MNDVLKDALSSVTYILREFAKCQCKECDENCMIVLNNYRKLCKEESERTKLQVAS